MAGGPVHRPVVLERGKRLFGATLAASAPAFFALLMIVDPVGGHRTAPTKPPVDAPIVSIEDLPPVPHQAELSKSIDSALSWLAKHQYEDGSWSASAYNQLCRDPIVCLGAGREEHSLAVTALAVVAFLQVAGRRLEQMKAQHAALLKQATAERDAAAEESRARWAEVEGLEPAPGEEAVEKQLHAARRALQVANERLRQAGTALKALAEGHEAEERLFVRDTVGAADFDTPTGRGLKWLVRQMDADDCCGGRQGNYMFGHALGTLAFAHAYAVSWDPIHKYWARRALEFLLNARNPGGGWGYTFRGGDSNPQVTGWAMAAVEAAREVGLSADPALDYEIARWLDDMTDPLNYRTGYKVPGGRGWSIPGVNDRYDDHETNTAVALHIRMAIKQSKGYAAAVGASWRLSTDLPVAGRDGASVDYLYWHHGTQALVRHQAPDGAIWNHWHRRAVSTILAGQRSYRDGCYQGSWNPDDRWGCEGGRVYATAINAITLATIERALPTPSKAD